MLGFVLSKMQMLLFATGICVVALMLLNFTSTMELRNSTSSLLEVNTQLINGILSSDTFCAFQSTTIPEFLSYGLANNRFYYELAFSRVGFDDGEQPYQKLILSINEYKKSNAIDAKSVNVYGNIVLVDPSFIASSDVITSAIVGVEKISLYPRQSNRGQAIASPNAFVVLKDTMSSDKLDLYIIPCTTLSKSFTSSDGTIFYANNCEENVFKVGCYLLKQSKGNPAPNDLVPQCFSITSEISQDAGVASEVRNFSWRDCVNIGYS